MVDCCWAFPSQSPKAPAQFSGSNALACAQGPPERPCTSVSSFRLGGSGRAPGRPPARGSSALWVIHSMGGERGAEQRNLQLQPRARRDTRAVQGSWRH